MPCLAIGICPAGKGIKLQDLSWTDWVTLGNQVLRFIKCAFKHLIDEIILNLLKVYVKERQKERRKWRVSRPLHKRYLRGMK